MKPVEEYIHISPQDVTKANTSKNFVLVQGRNILFTYDDYRTIDIELFLESVFSIVGKIVVEGKDGLHFILSDRFSKIEVIEPFLKCEDVSERFSHDTKKMSMFISTFFTSKYDI